MQEMQFQYLSREDHLEEGMGTHSSILAWEIPWTEEPGELQYRGSFSDLTATICLQLLEATTRWW